jgi:hypothetical protein
MLEVALPEIEPKLQLEQNILTIGSCFSAHMQERLTLNKFNALAHPFGTLYHPEAIAQALYPSDQVSINKDLIQSNDLWFHWDAHSVVWGNTQEEIVQRYKEACQSFINYISKADWLIITLGSAFVYRLLEDDRYVANCHKISQNHFRKELSSETSLLSTLEKLIDKLKDDYSNMNIILTVSPVRHYRDGLIENNVSKGRLLSVAYELNNKYSHITYFPSYELVIDQLRDYQYFKYDKVHPNDNAVGVIWGYLIKCWLDEKSSLFVEKWSKIHQAMNHKPLYPGSKSHQKFLKSILAKVQELSHQKNFSSEIQALKKELETYS